MQFHNKDLVEKAYAEGSKSKDAFAMRLTIVDEGAPAPMAQSSESEGEQTHFDDEESPPEEVGVVMGKIELAKQQGFTGAICSGCGSLRVKANGSCEVCLDCGSTSGCS